MAVLVGPLVLVVNAGSASLKLHVVDRHQVSMRVDSLEAAGDVRLEAVAHRVVHGGPRFRDPVVIDAAVKQDIFELEPLAPLHNAPALAAIERAQSVFPRVPHVAVFDTAFHSTIPEEAAVYAVPRRWREEWGVHRYGFHGLSVEWCAERTRQLLGWPGPRSSTRVRSNPSSPEHQRLLVFHLGGGSSLTAVLDGRSVDTTMGFSPLEGVPMATRSGSVDPGALIYLLRERGLDAAALDHALNFESGLRGLAGWGGDFQQIEQAATQGQEAALLALGVFFHRTAAAAWAMTAALGGLDAVAFTAGIGENSALVRAGLCERLAPLGVELDRHLNKNRAPDCDVAMPASRVRVLVIRTREELVAARKARELIGSS